MSRWAAFGIHLSISLAIFAVLAYLLLFVWFPGFYYETDGGIQGMRIVILVDLVLGPLLTLIVYRHGKPGLAFDLSVIAFLQAAALTAGVSIIYSQRPLALVYNDGRLFTVSADDYEEAGVPVPDLSRFPGPSPKQLAVQLPEDRNAEIELRSRLYEKGQPLRTWAEGYQPLTANLDLLLERAFDADFVHAHDPDRVLEQWLEETGRDPDGLAFLPFAARYRYVFAVLDRQTGTLLDVIDVEAPMNLAI